MSAIELQKVAEVVKIEIINNSCGCIELQKVAEVVKIEIINNSCGCIVLQTQLAFFPRSSNKLVTLDL